MKYLWILLILSTLSMPGRATGLEHFGTAYAGATFGYGLVERMFKTDSQLFNIIFTDIVVSGFLVMAEADKNKVNGSTLAAGLTGMFLSNFTVKVFSW